MTTGNRLALVLSLSLLALGVVTVRGSYGRLSRQEMGRCRGEGAQAGKCTGNRCDGIGNNPVYVGCNVVNGPCTQCANANGVPSLYDSVDVINKCGNNGNFWTNGGNTQDCGTQWNGTCSANPNSPTGFTCNFADTRVRCVNPDPPTVVGQIIGGG